MWRRKRQSDQKRKGLLGRFLKNKDGVTAIEFAMVGGPFLYLLCVIFETGLMLFSEYIIENGVARASRMIRTGQVQINGMSSSQFKDVDLRQARHRSSTAKTNCISTFANSRISASISLPSAYNGKELSADVTTAAKFQPGVALEVVVVRAYYEWKLFVPGLSQLENLSGGRRSLTSGAAFRNEPYTT